MKKLIIKYTKYILLATLFIGGYACEQPENDIETQLSINAMIVRFRIYQNQNIFFDGVIRENTILVTIPEGIDKTNIYPEILLSAGATCNPASGTLQDFTNAVTYTVTSENKKVTNTYEVVVNH
jgi:hypothetical protein